MAFIIKITEVKQVQSMESTRRDKTVLVTDEMFAKIGYSQESLIKNKLASGKVPTFEETYYENAPVTRKVETDILSQTVEELDLASVIKAINKL